MALPTARRLRIIVHGGTRKTGTTSLQHLLGSSRKALLEEGICYPDLEDTHHRMLSAKMIEWEPTACLNSLEQAKRNGAETVIFSSEVVSTLSFEQFGKLTACFSEHDLTYLFCFRHWWDYFPSRWSQNCARRDTQTFGAYVQAVTRSGSRHADYRFDLVLDRAVSSGNCRVAAVSYDNAMVVDGSIIPTILRAAGLPEHLIRRLGSHQHRHNTRYDPMLIELCRLFNGIIADRKQLPQDDLYHSVAEYRRCQQFFDLPPKIATLDDPVRKEMFTIIAKHGTKTLNLPDMHEVLHTLLLKHGSRFTNKIEGRIFLDKIPAELSYSDLVWEDFRDLTRGFDALAIS